MKVIYLIFLFVCFTHAAPTYPFGASLGENRRVTAFSNGGNLTSSQSNYVDGYLYSGAKWQCVEYARRWLITVKNITFVSVDKAADIWNLDPLNSWTNTPGPTGTGTVPMTRHTNGVATKLPQVGSLIVWPAGPAIGKYGHVAVVTGVGANVVYVTEQNYDDTVQWIGTRDYSRSLPVLKLPSGQFQIQSPEPIFGWISLSPFVSGPEKLKENKGEINVVFFVVFPVCFAISIVGYALFNIMMDTEDQIRESDRPEAHTQEEHWMWGQGVEVDVQGLTPLDSTLTSSQGQAEL